MVDCQIPHGQNSTLLGDVDVFVLPEIAFLKAHVVGRKGVEKKVRNYALFHWPFFLAFRLFQNSGDC